MISICALCENNADLQNSHLIPKWAYRRISQVDSKNPHSAPALISNGIARITNQQTTKDLLCTKCEQLFSISENYVAKLTEQENGKIKLCNLITRLEAPRKILASFNQDVDIDQIAYFAISIFWRGSVMTGDCKLGPYKQKFREYLLGQSNFPSDVYISLALLDESSLVDARGWVSEPSSSKYRMNWLHGFLLAGIAFRCWIGKDIPDGWLQVSITGPNRNKYISIIKPEECADFLAAIDVASTAKPKGRLVTFKPEP